MPRMFTEEERIQESRKARIRNESTISIKIIENGITVKEGNQHPDQAVYFPSFDHAIEHIAEIIAKKTEIINEPLPSFDNDRGRASKNLRISSRRETYLGEYNPNDKG